MIRNWSVRNFKSIKSADLELAPINVIVGANSVGKSALIQSILLLGQYVDEQVKATFPDRFSVFGHTLDIGGAKTLVTVGGSKPAKAVEIKATFETHNRDSGVLQMPTEEWVEEMILRVDKADPLGFTFEKKASKQLLKGMRLYAENLTSGDKTSVQLSLDFGEKSPTVIGQIVIKDFIPEVKMQPWFDLLFRACFKYFETLAKGKRSAFAFAREEFTREYLGMWLKERKKQKSFNSKVELEKFLQDFGIGSQPNDVLEKASTVKELSRKDLQKIMRSLSLVPKVDESDLVDERYSALHSWTIRECNTLANGLKRLGVNVLYLGPLRSIMPRDQQNYKSSSDIAPIGTRGEYLAHFLRNTSEVSKFPMPNNKSKITTLGLACEEWMRFLKIDGEIRSGLKGDYPEVLVDERSLNQIGTGISQVLPVVALTLLATTRPEPVVLLEQPELHLHPDLQRKLADFFVLLSRQKVKFLIETHSEYLITRLRLFAAQGKLSERQLSLIFVEKTKASKEESARFRQEFVDNLGRSAYWPKGFFDSSLLDRYALSTFQIPSD